MNNKTLGTKFEKDKQRSYPVKPGATIGKISDIKKKVKLGGFGNWIALNSNKNMLWHPSKRLVGKYAGLKEKGTKVGSDWVKNLKVRSLKAASTTTSETLFTGNRLET